MILLDTNVVSEAMKPEPHPSVRAWLDAQAAETLFLSSITIAELCSASARCRAASARTCWQLRSTACWTCSRPASCPSIPPAARRYADLAVKARAAGKGFPTPDGYIAAIAAAHGFAVASRDTSAFNAAGLTVIDPWTVTS